jgi:hypothetical protein
MLPPPQGSQQTCGSEVCKSFGAGQGSAGKSVVSSFLIASLHTILGVPFIQQTFETPIRSSLGIVNEMINERTDNLRKRMRLPPAQKYTGLPRTTNTTQGLLAHFNGNGAPGEEQIMFAWQGCCIRKLVVGIGNFLIKIF